jgi:hypothetical protein
MVVDLLNKGEHLRLEGLHKIVSIRASINKGLTPELEAAFPDIVPVERPLVAPGNLGPNWVAGFVTGEGCFFIEIKNSKTKIGFSVGLRFSITQHSRDTILFDNLRKN